MTETNQSRKIAIVLDTSLDQPDGVQQYVLSIRDWLVSMGHDVHFIVGETHRTDIPNVHSVARNVTVAFNGNKMSIPLWAHRRKLKQLLAEHSFDVLHVQAPYHPLMAQQIIRLAPSTTAVVSTFHILPYGRLASIGTKLLGILLRPSLSRIDTCLAVSSSAAAFAERCFRLPHSVSPNVFDYDRFARASPLAQYSDDRITILFLGRLVERKGCRLLLEAIAGLDRATLPSFRVVICGKGQQLSELQSFVANNNLADCVEFVGFVSEDDKPSYYASAELAIFPSISGESFGIVLLEAMAAGSAAVLAGNNPGYATVMEPFPEQLFEPHDIRELRDLITRFLQDDNLRLNRARAGSAYVKSFDTHSVGPTLMAEYNKAIAKRHNSQHN